MNFKILAGAAVLVASATANANLLQNGGFDTPFTGAPTSGTWAIFASLPGWTVGMPYGIEVRNNVAGVANTSPYFVELDTTNNSWISQTFTSSVTGPATLSFMYAGRADFGSRADNGIGFSITGDGGFSYSGSVPTPNANNDWFSFSAGVGSFVSGASYTLQFDATGTSDSYGSSLDTVSVTAVPEPASYALMLAGLGVVGVAARRRAARGG